MFIGRPNDLSRFAVFSELSQEALGSVEGVAHIGIMSIVTWARSPFRPVTTRTGMVCHESLSGQTDAIKDGSGAVVEVSRAVVCKNESNSNFKISVSFAMCFLYFGFVAMNSFPVFLFRKMLLEFLKGRANSPSNVMRIPFSKRWITGEDVI
jgi:hypothetical protein